MNDGVALNAQTDLLPICGMDEHMDTAAFLQILADETGENPEDILCFDLSVYHYAERAHRIFRRYVYGTAH